MKISKFWGNEFFEDFLQTPLPFPGSVFYPPSFEYGRKTIQNHSKEPFKINCWSKGWNLRRHEGKIQD